MNTSEVGTVAAELMDIIDDAYSDQQVRVGTVAIVVELEGERGDGREWDAVLYRCSDPRRWVQEAFFRAAERAVRAGEEST